MYLGILCTMINGFGRRGFYNSQEIGLGRALTAMGHRVTVYKCLNRASGQKEETLCLSSALTVRYLPVAGLGAHGYLRESVLDKHLDGLLCFADNQIFLPHIQRFCKKHSIVFVPYVGTAHSLHSGFHGWAMDACFAVGTGRLLRSHRVIVKTEGAKKELADMGITDTVISPVGLDTAALRQDFRQADRAALRREFGFGPEDTVVCSVCRMEAEKRPLELLELFGRLREHGPFRLVLVGDGLLLEEVSLQVRARHLEKDVRLLRQLPYGDMWKVYRVSDYFVNLNRGEIFGMAVMEAVYYGVSVAAIAAPGPSLTLAGLKGHRLCQTDEQIIGWLLGPRPEARLLEESGQILAARFSWDRCAQTLVQIVEEGQPNG